MRTLLDGARLRERLRRSLPTSAKNLVGDVLCHPLIGRTIAIRFGNRIPSGRFRIDTSHPSITLDTKAQIFWGIYESAEIRFVDRYLRPDLDVLEVGSSLGIVSCHALGKSGGRSRMVCVEANPALIPVIQGNLEANHPGSRALVVNRALDYLNPNGTTRLRLSGDTSESRLGRLAGSSDPTALEVEVATTTIRSLVSEHGLGEYALISDVEGAEAGFVFGDPAELDGCRQIVIELHDTEHAGRRLRWQDLLAELEGRFAFRVVDSFGPVHVLER